jgi:hypothetical protein
MLALVASTVLIAYLLAPGLLFKFIFSLFIPLEKFRRTRSEEFTFGAVTTLLPLTLTLLSVLNGGWIGNHPFSFPDSPAQKQADYRMVASSLHSDAYFLQHQTEFWDASSRVTQRQGRILVWLYVSTIVEAFLFGWLGKRYARFRRFKPYAFLAEKLLIPNISSWYVLLTTFSWPEQPERKVIADLLTSDDHLYRGQIVGYEVDAEGNLRGIMLNDALRFDRHSYLKGKDAKNSVNKDHYWKKIPGRNLFVFADKLSTMNLSSFPPTSSIPGILEGVLKKLKIDAQVKVQPPTPGSRKGDA